MSAAPQPLRRLSQYHTQTGGGSAEIGGRRHPIGVGEGARRGGAHRRRSRRAPWARHRSTPRPCETRGSRGSRTGRSRGRSTRARTGRRCRRKRGSRRGGQLARRDDGRRGGAGVRNSKGVGEEGPDDVQVGIVAFADGLKEGHHHGSQAQATVARGDCDGRDVAAAKEGTR